MDANNDGKITKVSIIISKARATPLGAQPGTVPAK